MPRGAPTGSPSKISSPASRSTRCSSSRASGGFAAAGFADDAEGLAFEQGEGDTVDRAHACGLAGAADVEVLGEVARDQQRLRRAADVARVGGDRVVHSRTSMAERMPSLTRLKQIEVTKIAAPGSAQDSGAM